MGAGYAATTQIQALDTLSFLKWIVTAGQATGPTAPTTTLGYPPLPASVATISVQLLASITYNGTPVLTGS